MLILIVGPSGAGKDTLLGGDAGVRFVRRVITRDDDGGEEGHEAVTEEAFRVREAAVDFALSWRAHGLRYGVPADIAPDLARGRVVVVNVSRAVVAEAAARFPVAVVEITAPTGMLAERQVVVNDGTVEEGAERLRAAIRMASGGVGRV